MALSASDIARYAYQAGFRGQALTTAVAIALAESSGNAGARNPNGEDSRGLWQINVAPNVRPNKWGDLYDPAVNARAAFEVSGGGANFRPWTTYSGTTAHGRAASYTKHLTVASAAVSGLGENPGAPRTYSGVSAMAIDDDGLASDASEDQIRDYIRTKMPEFGYLLDNDELFQTAVRWARDDAPEEDLAARIRQTEYWRETAPSARAWNELISSDPAAAEAKLLAKLGEVQRIAHSNGYNMIEGKEIWDTADLAIRSGWTADDLNRYIVDKVLYIGGTTAGAKVASADMVATAGRYGVTLPRRQAEEWAMQIERGAFSEAGFESWVLEQAKSRWASSPQILEFIDQGGTPYDYFGSHRQTIADTLELNEADVDVFSGQFASVSDMYDEKAKGNRPMTISEARKLAMKDDRVKQTAWFKQEDAQWASGVGRLLNVLPGGG